MTIPRRKVKGRTAVSRGPRIYVGPLTNQILHYRQMTPIRRQVKGRLAAKVELRVKVHARLHEQPDNFQVARLSRIYKSRLRVGDT